MEEEDKKPVLVWTAPECPLRVTIQADVLNEVRILAVEAFYSVPRGGVEIGGVFFGARDGDSIHIQAHRPIRCEYSTGPSFTLSVKDQLGLSGLLDQAPSEPDLAGLSSLGWYHSHTRSEIFLSPVDLQLYSEFFPEKYQIALVVRPGNLQPTRGGFFFRDRRGIVKSDSPVLELKLEPPDFGLAVFDSSYPLPAAHERVVPETTEPAVIASVSEVAVPHVEPAAPVAIPAGIAAAATAGSAAAIAIAPAPANPPEVEPALHAADHSVLRVPSFGLPAASKSNHRGTTWIRAVIVMIVLGLGGSVAFLQWGKIGQPPALGLETYDINGAFLIRWDRNSSAIRQASHAILEIEDGGEKVDPISLTPDELSVGGYPYMRHTAQVSVRMTTDGPAPLEELIHFAPAQALGSQPLQGTQPPALLSQALQDKQHLTTELINESMQASELRRENTSLRRQLAEERARNTSNKNQ